MRFNKQKIIKILPFPFLAYFFNKISEAFTTAAGTTAGEKIIEGMAALFPKTQKMRTKKMMNMENQIGIRLWA